MGASRPAIRALRALLCGRFAPCFMGASCHALWALRAMRYGLKQNIDDARNNHSCMSITLIFALLMKQIFANIKHPSSCE